MLLSRKSDLQLFEKVLVRIVNFVLENDMKWDFLFCKSQEVVFEGLIGDFVVSQVERSGRSIEKIVIRREDFLVWSDEQCARNILQSGKKS
jgi:hypothetical protein